MAVTDSPQWSARLGDALVSRETKYSDLMLARGPGPHDECYCYLSGQMSVYSAVLYCTRAMSTQRNETTGSLQHDQHHEPLGFGMDSCLQGT